jgi:hypothetical protein
MPRDAFQNSDTFSARKPNPSKSTVLLHFCFDQQARETKREWCRCKWRISRDDAFRFVKEGRADWLLVKNPKTAELVKFHRAIVIRRAIVNNEMLFAVTPPIKVDPRQEKHEAIKQAVRHDARRILQKLVYKRVISKEGFKRDADLDKLLSDENESTAFLQKLIGLGEADAYEQMVRVMAQWWENVLAFQRLHMNAGKFIKNAPRGRGELLAVPAGAGVQPDLADGGS